jgi:hypothetical protein
LESTIIGEFDTRRDAELAVGHIVVQECDVPRSDVFVQSVGGANMAGTHPAGADAKAGRHLRRIRTRKARSKVSVDFHADDPERIAAALKDPGAKPSV